jgi:hypothetical protein
MNDTLLLIGRSLRNTLREPATVLPNIAISVFFLFVYDAGLSSVAELPGFQGTYLGFILPVAIVSAAVGGAGLAGQTLIKDIDNGYFTKLLLTPTRRLAVIWGPMVASAIILTAQVVLVMILALFMGLKVATGPIGFLLVVVLAFLWGAAHEERRGGPGGDLRLLPAHLPELHVRPRGVRDRHVAQGGGDHQPDDLRVRRDAFAAEHRLGRDVAAGRLRRHLRVRHGDRHHGALGGAGGHEALVVTLA